MPTAKRLRAAYERGWREGAHAAVDGEPPSLMEAVDERKLGMSEHDQALIREQKRGIAAGRASVRRP